MLRNVSVMLRNVTKPLEYTHLSERRHVFTHHPVFHSFCHPCTVPFSMRTQTTKTQQERLHKSKNKPGVLIFHRLLTRNRCEVIDEDTQQLATKRSIVRSRCLDTGDCKFSQSILLFTCRERPVKVSKKSQ